MVHMWRTHLREIGVFHFVEVHNTKILTGSAGSRPCRGPDGTGMSSPIVPNVLTNVAATRALDGLQELTRNVAAPSERSRQCKKVQTFCIYSS